jgi:hypothetical protein
LLKLTCEYQDKPATIRLRNTWVEYDPRGWSAEMDVNINVGLGTGDKGQTVQFLSMMGAYFQQAAPLGVVQPNNVYELGKMLLKAGNIQGGDRLLTDPANAPAKAPQKSPEQILAETELQLEQLRQQGKREEGERQAASARAKLEADTALRTMDLQLKDKEIRIKEIDLGLKQIELEHNLRRNTHNDAMAHQGQLHGQMIAQHGAEQRHAAQQHPGVPPMNDYHEGRDVP